MFSVNSYINDINDRLPYFKTRETNHLPMALYALYQISANESDINKFRDYYLENHDMVPLRPDHATIEIGNWRNFLGNQDSYEAYQAFFSREVSKYGVFAVLDRFFEPLANGIASEAFHCLIEICYGIESKNDKEVVNGLAYLCSCYFAIPDFKIEPSCSVKEFIQKVQQLPWYGQRKYDGSTISEKLIEVFNSDEFKNEMQFPDFDDPDVIAEMETAVLKLHLHKWNFISLHLVTSFHSLAIILPFVGDKQMLYRFFWIAMTACLYTFNDAPDYPPLIFSEKEFNWAGTFRKAIDSMDEHVIKLVYSCYKEFNKTHNQLYKAIANEIAAKGLKH